jgi:hypothetical protein
MLTKDGYIEGDRALKIITYIKVEIIYLYEDINERVAR